VNSEASVDVSFLFNHEEREGFHAKARRKGKEDGRLYYSLSFPVSSNVPTFPELQSSEERKEKSQAPIGCKGR